MIRPQKGPFAISTCLSACTDGGTRDVPDDVFSHECLFPFSLPLPLYLIYNFIMATKSQLKTCSFFSVLLQWNWTRQLVLASPILYWFKCALIILFIMHTPLSSQSPIILTDIYWCSSHRLSQHSHAFCIYLYIYSLSLFHFEWSNSLLLTIIYVIFSLNLSVKLILQGVKIQYPCSWYTNAYF